MIFGGTKLLSCAWVICVLSASVALTAAVSQGADGDEEHEVYEAYHPAKLREGRPHPGKAKATMGPTGMLRAVESQTSPESCTRFLFSFPFLFHMIAFVLEACLR